MYLSEDEVPEDVIEREKNIYKEQALESGKPEKVVEKIVDGKLKKFMKEVCLLGQPYIKDTDMDVSGYLKEAIAKIGENIVIRRFSRFQLGEGNK